MEIRRTPLIVLLIFVQTVSAGVQLSSDHGPEMDICPGTNVTFTCTAPVSVTIQWNYNGITAAVTEHSTGTRIMGPFTVQVIAKDMSSFSSTAVATITAEVRGDLTCKNRESSTDAKSIAIPELKVSAAPSNVSSTLTYLIAPGNGHGKLESIKLTWIPVSPVPDCNCPIEGYEISVTGTDRTSFIYVEQSSCDAMCSAVVDVPKTGCSEYNISAAANTTCGLGDITTVGPYSYDNTYVYVNVTATTDTSDALDCSLYVTCGDSGDGSYDVSISPGKLLQTTFDCPHDSTIISVFDADSDDSLDSYHYTVVGESGQEDTVMVKGSFEGICPQRGGVGGGNSGETIMLAVVVSLGLVVVDGGIPGHGVLLLW